MNAVWTTFGPDDAATPAAPSAAPGLVVSPPSPFCGVCSRSGLLCGGPIEFDEGEVISIWSTSGETDDVADDEGSNERLRDRVGKLTTGRSERPLDSTTVAILPAMARALSLATAITLLSCAQFLFILVRELLRVVV